MKIALRALVDLAGGYCATPEQMLQIARQYDVEAWQLEGFYFDEMERAGDE